MLAYHNDPKIKTGILMQLTAHTEADEIVKGHYWENGKGCAVGCTLHSGDHMEYEARFGIPVMLARLEDTLFEGLPNGESKAWPVKFMTAFQPGLDYTLVGWRFLYWLLTTESVNPGINHPLVKDAIKQCALVVSARSHGESVARSAADAAAHAAAHAADAAAHAADAVRSAADAAYAAYAAAHAADAAGSAAYVEMSNKLIVLIEEV